MTTLIPSALEFIPKVVRRHGKWTTDDANQVAPLFGNNTFFTGILPYACQRMSFNRQQLRLLSNSPTFRFVTQLRLYDAKFSLDEMKQLVGKVDFCRQLYVHEYFARAPSSDSSQQGGAAVHVDDFVEWLVSLPFLGVFGVLPHDAPHTCARGNKPLTFNHLQRLLSHPRESFRASIARNIYLLSEPQPEVFRELLLPVLDDMTLTVEVTASFLACAQKLLLAHHHFIYDHGAIADLIPRLIQAVRVHLTATSERVRFEAVRLLGSLAYKVSSAYLNLFAEKGHQAAIKSLLSGRNEQGEEEDEPLMPQVRQLIRRMVRFAQKELRHQPSEHMMLLQPVWWLMDEIFGDQSYQPFLSAELGGGRTEIARLADIGSLVADGTITLLFEPFIDNVELWGEGKIVSRLCLFISHFPLESVQGRLLERATEQFRRLLERTEEQFTFVDRHLANRIPEVSSILNIFQMRRLKSLIAALCTPRSRIPPSRSNMLACWRHFLVELRMETLLRKLLSSHLQHPPVVERNTLAPVEAMFSELREAFEKFELPLMKEQRKSWKTIGCRRGRQGEDREKPILCELALIKI